MYHKSRYCPGQTQALHILNILLKQSTLHNTHPIQKSSPKEGIIPHLSLASNRARCPPLDAPIPPVTTHLNLSQHLPLGGRLSPLKNPHPNYLSIKLSESPKTFIPRAHLRSRYERSHHLCKVTSALLPSPLLRSLLLL